MISHCGLLVGIILASPVAVSCMGISWLWQSGEAPPKPKLPVYSVQLQKQYTPVLRNNTTVAYKTAYFGKLSVGTPAQEFTAVFDTGSGHVLLPSNKCRDETCTKHRRFQPQESNTSLDIDHKGVPIPVEQTSRSQATISFGTGKVKGEFARDVVCLGESRAEACTSMQLVVAINMSEDPFTQFEFDGVFGLGFGALVLSENFSFFSQLVATHPSMAPVFAVYLARDDTTTSSIAFGGYEEWRAASALSWAPVEPKALGHWVVSIKEVRIGGKVLDECAAGDCRAVLDTGTSLLAVPRSATLAMHTRLTREAPETDGAAVDCRTVPGEELTFDLGGPILSLGVEDYSRPSPVNMTLPGTDVQKAYCRSTLLPIDMKAPLGPKLFILGEPFLRRYFTVFDWAEKRVGFALADHAAVRARLGPRTDSISTPVGNAVGSPPAASLILGAPLRSSA